MPFRSRTSDNQFVTRVDYTINAKNNLYGRYFLDGYQAPGLLFSNQHPRHHAVRKHSAGAVLHSRRGLHDQLEDREHGPRHVLRRRNNRGYAPTTSTPPLSASMLYQGEPNGLQLTTTNKFTIGGGTNSVSHFNDNTLCPHRRRDHAARQAPDRLRRRVGPEPAQYRQCLRVQRRLHLQTASTAPADRTEERRSATPTSTSSWERRAPSSRANSSRTRCAGRFPVSTFRTPSTPPTRLTLVAGLRWGPNFMPVRLLQSRHRLQHGRNFLANKVSSIYPNAPAGALYYGDPGVSTSVHEELALAVLSELSVSP